jgi:hypothetical protein
VPALNQAHANNIIDASVGTAAFTATTTPLRVRLMTANGSATAAGTEVVNAGGSTYAQQNVTFGAAAAGSAASGGASGTVTFTNMPAVTVVGVELWDSAATPVRKWYGALTASKATNLGDTFQIAAGQLTVALA